MDREELKLKLINELIDKGLSDDQILEIVEKHFPLDVVAAPAPPTSVTPQQALNRTVAAIKKVKDVKADASIKVIDANGDDTKTLGTLDETNAQNKLMTVGYTNVKLEARVPKTGVAFYKGETITFNVEQPSTSKFADTTLFDKVVLPALTIPAKDVVVGFATITNDKSVQAPAGTKFGPVVFGAGQNSHGAYDAYIGTATNIKSGNIDNGYSNRGSFSISDTTASLTKQGGDTYNSAISVSIIETIPAQVIRATTEYQYTAKKDITHADMGEN